MELNKHVLLGSYLRNVQDLGRQEWGLYVTPTGSSVAVHSMKWKQPATQKEERKWQK